MYYYPYIDYTYLVFILPALILALWAQHNVKATYQKYSRVGNGRGLTGQAAARHILDDSGLYNVPVECIRGRLSDHYDPRANAVRLSEDVYHSASISAVGIAAHECGHAVQHAKGYLPIKIRSAIIPVTNIGSKLAIPLLLVGLLLSYYPLILIGIFGYALMALFQLVTLPVEFNASSRALKVIDSHHLLEGQEQAGARKVLGAAAMTYVAALASSIASVLRLLVLFGGGGRNRRR